MTDTMPRYNIEGYSDPTAHMALSGVQQEQSEADLRFNRLLKSLKAFIDLAGYDLLCRIELRDRRTGKEYV